MTLLTLYAIIKFWAPILAFFGLVYKGYQNAKSGAAKWANNLLDNHMTHIQEAVEQSSASMVSLAGYHKDLLDSQNKMLVEMSSMSRDFHDHCRDDRDFQAKMNTALEVLDTKVSL